MKKNIFIVMFLINIHFVIAQPNLIPNPSFEQKTDPNECYDMPIMLSYEFANIVADWKADDADPLVATSSRNTPDYFNSCADPNAGAPVSVPQNFMGNQHAKDGNAYVGINYGFNMKWPTNGLPDHGSEYIFTELTNPLEAGEVYTFSMYVSKADLLSYAANQLGAAFLNVLPFAGGHMNSTLALTPQVLNTNIVSDETNWTRIEGLFTAQGNEKYVIIGYFPNTQTLQVLKNGVSVDYADGFNTYYYIDDVSLRKGNFLSSEIFNREDIQIYPNPTENIVLIEGSEIKRIIIFDVNGKKIKESLNSNVINMQSFSSGVYFFKIETKEGFVLTEKIIKK